MKCFMTNQECIFEKVIQDYHTQKTAEMLFVVSPFGYPYDEMYSNIIQEACKAAKIVPQRADRAFQLGFVMCTKICQLIQQADFVLVDVTQDNPNVFYELGLAWGFGKKVVLLRDTDAPKSRGFIEVFGNTPVHVLSYADVLSLENASDKERASELCRFLQKTVTSGEQDGIDQKPCLNTNAPPKRICFCSREGLPDTKFYMRAIEASANGVSTTDTWDVQAVPLTTKPKPPISQTLPQHLAQSKVLIVDVTHYNNQVDTSVYFALGLSHAMGRETIPITNRARCDDVSPFDVRGLWQVYFDKLSELETELQGIIQVITKQYDKEKSEYPLRFIWDKVLRDSARLSVFTCARGAPVDVNRVGGRTNVDKWDYSSVAELALFLAHKYNRAEMRIEAPSEKVTAGLETEKERKSLASRITKTLGDVQNSLIIIGSPDVSDFSEVVLARLYGVNPYNPERCWQTREEKRRRCWECTKGNDHNCIGKRGYLFYKKTTTTDHPREISSFFRKPPNGVRECVLWYGDRYECEHSRRGRNEEGQTFGVLTLFRDRKECYDSRNKMRWIILFSGFSGIATYGLTQLLTSLNVKTLDGKTLQNVITDRKIDIDKEGIQVLVNVRYTSISGDQSRDFREHLGTTVIDVKPLFPVAVNFP